MGAWHDRYRTPAAEDLLAGLPEERRGHADEALRRLGRKPRPLWIEPWRWTLVIDHPSGPVYLVPDPERLVIAARIPRDYFEEHALPGVSRAAREAIVAASCVGEVVWVEWGVPSTGVLDAVMAIVNRD